MNVKKCYCCKKEKPLSEFSKDNKRKDGLFIYCKECQKQKYKIYYDKNKEHIKELNNTPEKKEKRKIYENTPKRKEHKKKVYREYYKKHREQ